MDFNSLKYRTRKTCSVCEKSLGDSVIPLPEFPITEILIKQKLPPQGFLDQAFMFCEHCGHGQLQNVIDPEILYGGDYAFRTSQSRSSAAGNKFFLEFVDRVTQGTKFDTVVDIGCNDLHMLQALEHRADRLIGIDPMLPKLKAAAPSQKYQLIGDFIENVALSDLVSNQGTLFVCSHNLEHIENPRLMIERLLAAANQNTVFAFQFPGLETLVSNFRFDHLFHHHVQYFSLPSVAHAIESAGGTVLHHMVNTSFWGSLLIVFKKGSESVLRKGEKFSKTTIRQRYDYFRHNLMLAGEFLKNFNDKKWDGKKIIGYGAALTLPAVAYHMKHDLSNLECVVDDDPCKAGLYYLNLPVQIKMPKDAGSIEQQTVVITALNNVRQIVEKLNPLKPKHILVPLACF